MSLQESHRPNESGYDDNLCECQSQKNFKKKKNFKWPSLKVCPNCNSHRVWKHGFVLRLFDGFDEGLWLRRYRCPDCKTVITMRPRDYLPRFQAPLAIIRKSLLSKKYKNQWLPGISCSRQNFWWQSFKQKVFACWGNLLYFGLTSQDELKTPLFSVKDLFEALIRGGIYHPAGQFKPHRTAVFVQPT